MQYMPLMFDTLTMDLMCDVRRAFDRDGRANPGKVVPVRSCREWRAGGVI
jgi:FAD/FMN-containing dehydrogenase